MENLVRTCELFLSEEDDSVKAISGNDSLKVVLVVGESMSVYHCSLYGYEKPTTPYLSQRKADGELAVYEDVVTVDDHTTGVMNSIFSLSRSQGELSSEFLFFPICFKAADYHTSLYENQFAIGNKTLLLSNKELSQLTFDERNDILFLHDGDLINSVTVQQGAELIVIHIYGSHYVYSERYPLHETYFTPDMYNFEDASVNLTVSQYDNSIRYTDKVLERLFKTLEEEDAVVVYLSDHGEDMYEQGSMGHGYAFSTKDIRYQIRVPMLIWSSKKFRLHHDKLWNQIVSSTQKKVTTDDVSHAILEIAGIRVPQFDETRSFINDSYSIGSGRTVLKNVNYDKLFDSSGNKSR